MGREQWVSKKTECKKIVLSEENARAAVQDLLDTYHIDVMAMTDSQWDALEPVLETLTRGFMTGDLSAEHNEAGLTITQVLSDGNEVKFAPLRTKMVLSIDRYQKQPLAQTYALLGAASGLKTGELFTPPPADNKMSTALAAVFMLALG
jgi:hypothetical protein